jgi:hypothetical protein
MSIFRDRLWYDSTINTLNCNGILKQNLVPSCSSTSAGTLTVANTTQVPIPFTSDTLVNWPTRATNTNFVAPQAGTYLVSVEAGYTTPPSGTGNSKLQLWYYTSGGTGTLLGEQTFPVANAVPTFQLTKIVTLLGNGDYVQAQLYQSSGSSAIAGGGNADGGNLNQLTMTKLY